MLYVSTRGGGKAQRFSDILLEQRYLRKRGFTLRDHQAVAESA